MEYIITKDNVICHSGIKGMKWGTRRFQNEDGSLTAAGKARYLEARVSNEIGREQAVTSAKREGKTIGKIIGGTAGLAIAGGVMASMAKRSNNTKNALLASGKSVPIKSSDEIISTTMKAGAFAIGMLKAGEVFGAKIGKTYAKNATNAQYADRSKALIDERYNVPVPTYKNYKKIQQENN